MKHFMLGTLVMIAGLFVLAPGAGAQTGGVVVHIDQDFVAGGKALPAGTYKVSEGSTATGQTLVLRDQESGASIFLVASTHDGAVEGPLVTKLTRAGDAYYLTELTTELGTYTFATPRGLTQTAKGKDQNVVATSGSN